MSFTFVVEKLKPGYIHACSIDEICEVLGYCPAGDLDGLRLVILRQPKKKEEVLSPCWGRFMYEFEYQSKLQPAIIIESVNPSNAIIMKGTGISPFLQKELEQLEAEGHKVQKTNKNIMIKPTLQSVKRTQLYRTVLHEVGHYVYHQSGYSSGKNHQEKETFANAYARKIRTSIPAVD